MALKFEPERVVVRRKELGLTQEALARLAGLSHSTVIMLESGRKVPNVNTLAKVALALKKGVAYFFVD